MRIRKVAERLRILRADHSAWRLQGDTGLFSLAGAQPKTALLLEKERWGVPSGRTPTTHILKPPAGPHAGFVVNEHLCLQLARRLEFPTANSSVMSFDGERAIVLERFDRVRRAEGWLRIHQEDLCQALDVNPSRKYQNDGGPGPRAIRISEIRRGDWLKATAQLQLNSDSLLARITHMADAIPEVAPETGAELKHAGVTEPIVDRLVIRLAGRARLCLKQMRG
jgi:hypothetical protein